MSLAVIFVIGFFGLGAVLTVTTVALLGIDKNYNTNSGNQTFYTAEAAVREGIYQYLASSSYSGGNFNQPINNISTSSIPISVTSSWPYIEVEGKAENNLTNRKVKSSLLLFAAGAAFDYAVYSEDDLSITGSTDITGDVFSNGIVTCSGSSNIEGNACSSGDDPSDSCNSHASSTEENVDIIPPPTIDPHYYGSIANCTSTLTNVETDCLSVPTTSVVFVDDPGSSEVLNNVDLSGNLTIIGDDITLNGGAVITASDDHVALVVDGNLTIVGGATITGIVYVSGNTSFGAGNINIIGSLISKEGITDLGGNVTIDYQGPSGPPGGVTDPPDPKIISWQEM